VPVKTTTTTERVPDSFIARIKTHPIPRARPLPGHYLFFLEYAKDLRIIVLRRIEFSLQTTRI
jgi:hypothetical protein